MGRQLFRICFWLLLSLCVFSALTGCGGRRQSNRPAPETKVETTKQVKPPEGIEIFLRIKDWYVEDQRVLDHNPEWGEIRYAGKHRYLNKVVMMLKASQFPNYYWLAELPQEANGDFTCTAKRYREHGTVPKPADPPDQFAITLVIKSKRIAQAAIDDPHPGWGKFVLSKYLDGILYLRNPFYPGELWAAQIPNSKGDGEWTIYAVLQ